MNEYTTRLIKTSEKGHTAAVHTVIVRTVCEVCRVPETPKGGTTSFGTEHCSAFFNKLMRHQPGGWRPALAPLPLIYFTFTLFMLSLVELQGA